VGGRRHAGPALRALLLALAATASGCRAGTDDAAAAGSGDGVSGAGESVRPFTIAVPDSVLTDLRARLARTREPDQIPGTAWTYGTDRAYLEGLLAYWRDGFDWRAQERRLNELDHFKTAIDGLDVHFVHQRSARPDAVPLLVIHGWPGSFVEYAGLLGPLTDPTAHGADASDAFHVVAPSLPGFGFSG
jgi:hypothetical protein